MTAGMDSTETETKFLGDGQLRSALDRQSFRLGEKVGGKAFGHQTFRKRPLNGSSQYRKQSSGMMVGGARLYSSCA